MASTKLISQDLAALRAALSKLAAQVARRNQLAVMLQSLQHETQQLQAQEQQLKRALAKEEADVERLKKMSATAILYSILGKKEAKFVKEAQEAAAARLRYTAAVQQLEDCQARIQQVQQELDRLRDCEAQYAALFGQLRQLLMRQPDAAAQLEQLDLALAESQSQLRELEEAIGAGNAALQQASVVLDSLSSAAGWGTWDLLGGGLISDLAKYSHLDNAQQNIQQLQALLSRFRTELADVHMAPQLGELASGGLLQMADIFFDNLFVDWAVLSQIHDSQAQMEQVRHQISGALEKLSRLHAYRLEESSRMEQQITALVTGL